MIELTQQQPADLPAIEALLDEAFGAGRRQKVSYRYRRDVAPLAALARVARDGERVVGTIRYWPVLIGAAGHAALLLGPVAVAPVARGQGLGGCLINSTLAEATAAGHARVLLVGDLAYYHRFGFGPSTGFGIAMPGERPERLLLRPLRPGGFDGVAGELHPASPSTEAAADRSQPPAFAALRLKG
jgi:predicted N-acetyltransferase YhbS